MSKYEAIREDRLKVTGYELLGKLPDPFLRPDGTRITDPARWEEQREVLARSAINLQYGTQPPAPEFLETELLYKADKIRGYRIRTGTRACPVTFRMQILLPQTEGKFPVIVDGDQCWMYHMDKEYLAPALDAGIGWVFFDRTELAHDLNDEGRGQGALYRTYPQYTFGALGAWAWGYSRCVDALEQLDLPVDLDWITFSGHSRGGKTAALAGALDVRAKIVNPNETCAGACGCYRVHMTALNERGENKRSETLADLWKNFSFWIGPGMEAYKDREADLPFDCHFLKALTAPRTLFVSEAAEDIWANPVGSWLTTDAAKEVYRFLGAEENLFWYYRPGGHGHKVQDVEMLVNLILHQRGGKPLDDGFFRRPFPAPEKAYDWTCPSETAQR